MRRIQHQRLPTWSRQERDRFRSSVVAGRRIRRAKTGDYLKTFGSRPVGQAELRGE